MKHTKGELQQMQSLPLVAKVEMTKRRIREWHEYFDGQVYVSFSGGKDSTVLLTIARSLYPDIEAVFIDTGLEYPEVRKFAKSFENVTVLRPKMRFDEVIKKYGYPIISKEVSECVYEARFSPSEYYRTARMKKLNGELLQKNGEKSAFNCEKYKPLLDVDFAICDKCCKVMKKSPAHAMKKKPITATMASESRLREQHWLAAGCNAFDGKKQISNPMSFWTENDVLQFIRDNGIKIAPVYGDIVFAENQNQFRFDIECEGCEKLCTTGCSRTGCIFCGFGAHLEKSPTRFERLKNTHPKQWKYCIGGGEYDERGLWVPNKQGLGLGHVFDELNNIYGDGFIRYGKEEK